MMRFLSVALVAASAVNAAHAWTANQCSNLINVLQLDPSVKILSTTPYPDNSTVVDPYSLAYPTPVPDLPAFCRVYANISTSPTSRTLFEVWLPLNTWNTRTMTVGNGGGNGAINLGQLGQGIRAGFATISTDCGHNSTSIDGAWEALGPEVATDFGWRSIHLSTLYGREILNQFYGMNYSYSYYVGCSSGGKQGYRELTLFPETFDGCLIGAPAFKWNYLNAFSIHVQTYQQPPTNQTPGYITAELMPWINSQVVAACDAADGVTDGVIANPRVCNFRPEQLLCKYFPENSTCLNVAQVETLENLYRDYYETNNTYIFPAYEKGSEGMWPVTLSGNSWNLQPAYYAYQVLNVSLNDWDPYTLNYSTIELAQYINPGDVICDVPDLTPYFNRNGKIIHYHGWADGLISSRSSVDYYNAVDRTLSGNYSENYRLFMVPGMQHCGGGPGPWVFNSDPETMALDATSDLYGQLMMWVEHGAAPETLLGTKYFNDTGPEILFQRPICPYPSEAVWTGMGQWQDPSTWTCKTDGVEV